MGKSANEDKGVLTWSFLTHHAHVLLILSKDQNLRLRDCARLIGITERAVQNIVSDLEAIGILNRSREGRRNHYEINQELNLPHTIEQHLSAGDLIKFAPDLDNIETQTLES